LPLKLAGPHSHAVPVFHFIDFYYQSSLLHISNKMRIYHNMQDKNTDTVISSVTYRSTITCKKKHYSSKRTSSPGGDTSRTELAYNLTLKTSGHHSWSFNQQGMRTILDPTYNRFMCIPKLGIRHRAASTPRALDYPPRISAKGPVTIRTVQATITGPTPQKIQQFL
jgi:hypothetical protein